MIELDQYQKQWIRLAKGHLKEEYPYKGQWANTAKPLWTKIYGCNPDEDNNYKDYCQGLFTVLLDIYLKIQDDQSGCNNEIHGIFKAAFYPDYSDQIRPIERAISALFSLLAFNLYLKDGKPRYEL